MNFDNIPDELRALPQWVVWGANKQPFCAKNGFPASVTNRDTWCSFDKAKDAFIGSNGRYSGLGFVFTADDPYCGIDLDNPYAINADGSPKHSPEKQIEVANRHRAILAAFNSYTETSPSGNGLHIIIKAKIPHDAPHRRDNVEIYSEGRFFTMTGNVYRAASIIDYDVLANQLCKEMGGDKPTLEFASQFYVAATESDGEILDKASSGPNGDKFRALWNGDGSVLSGGDTSGSVIDQALVNWLQKLTKDPNQIDRMWLASPQGQREKTQKRKDYRDRTINRAFDQELQPMDISAIMATAPTHVVPASRTNVPATRRPDPISARELWEKQFAPISYVVPGYIAEGLTVLAGKPKIGKSWLALEIGLAVASGGACLGDIRCIRGDVLYLALEDNQRRLQSRLKQLWKDEAASGLPAGFYFETEWPRASEGIAAIKEWISSHPQLRLVIVDVLAMFRAIGKDRNQTQYDADYLAIKGLQSLALETGVAIVVVHHTRKAQDQSDPFEKVSGTLGLSGAADTAIILDRDNNGCTLYGRGRDIEEFEVAVQFDKTNCKWHVLGLANDVRRSDARTAILAVLMDANEPMSPTDIATACNARNQNVRQLLLAMVNSGEVEKAGRGRYVHVDRNDLLPSTTPGHNNHLITSPTQNGRNSEV